MLGDGDLIVKTIETLKNEAKEIERQLAELPVYTNGGVSYSEAKAMSYTERNLFINTLNQKMQISSGIEYL